MRAEDFSLYWGKGKKINPLMLGGDKKVKHT